MRKGIKLLVALGIIFMPYFSLIGGEYYVSPNGSDSNPGTLDKPWRTIARANSSLRAGDILYIRGGIYLESIAPVNSGTPGSPIAYKNYRNEEVILQGGTGRLTGWEYVSGTIGEDAIFRKRFGHQPVGLFEDTFEKAGKFAIAWDKDTGSRGSNNGKIDGPGQFLYRGGYILFRSSDGRSPDDHDVRVVFREDAAIYLRASYIVVDGIMVRDWKYWVKIEPGSSHNVIQNCDMRFAAGWGGIVLQGSYNKILNNILQGGSSWMAHNLGGTISLVRTDSDGNYNLIEGNDISYGGHHNIEFKGGNGKSNFGNIIRNNYIHDSGGTNVLIRDGEHNVIERNTIVRAVSSREAAPGHPVGHPGIYVTGGSSHIIRGNLILENGGGAHGPGLTGTGGINHYYVYQNVVYENFDGVTTSDFQNEGTRENFFKNNIFYKNQRFFLNHDIPPDAIATKHFFKNNVIMQARANDIVARIYGRGEFTLAELQSKFPNFFAKNIEEDPQFVDLNSDNPDFHLRPDSPAIDAGAFLTTTISSGSGTTIRVEDAAYFTDGFGIIAGDFIQLEGDTTRAQIIKVDYSSNTLMLDRPLSWKAGQGVSLPYEGKAPDIGAFEAQNLVVLNASITLSQAPPLKDGSVEVILTTSRNVVKVPGPLILNESDQTTTLINLQGPVPGRVFTGTLKVDETVADGEGYFTLPENALIDTAGNRGNQVVAGVRVLINRTKPAPPKNVAANVIQR